MSAWVSNSVVLVILLSFGILATSRLYSCIRYVALQGAVLAVLPLMVVASESGGDEALFHAGVLALASLIIKAILMPWLIWRAIRSASIRREEEPLLGFELSLLIGAVLTGLAFWASHKLALEHSPYSRILSAGGMSTLMLGLLILVGRSKAISQVVGYLMVENGIFLFGMLLTTQMPFLVEVGILLDVLTGVLVMGIFAYRIQRTFDHMDTHNMLSLKD